MKQIILTLVFLFQFSFVAEAKQQRKTDVLFIGDSHSAGCFGTDLDQKLRTLPGVNNTKMKVISSATCGSRVSSWLKEKGHKTDCGYRYCNADGKCQLKTHGESDSLETLLENKPQVTIIALGTNMLKSPPRDAMNDVTKALDKIKASGSLCIWVGPPQASTSFISKQKYEEFVQRLDSTVSQSGCLFVSSSNKTARENINDPQGIHYGCNDSKQWADKAFKQLGPIVNGLYSASSNAADDTKATKPSAAR